MSIDWEALLGCGFIVLLIVSILAGTFWLLKPDPHRGEHCLFREGQFVESVLSGQVGQIIDTTVYSSTTPCYYNVRFVAKEEITNTHVFHGDEPIQARPLAVIKYMREYELKEHNNGR